MKKPNRLICLFAALLLLFSACTSTSAESSEPSTTAPSGLDTPTPSPESVPETMSAWVEGERARVTEAAEQFIKELQNQTEPTNKNANMSDRSALAAFERFFKLDTLFVSGVLVVPDAESYDCIIMGESRNNSGDRYRVNISFVGQELSWGCDMAYFLSQSDDAMQHYLRFLQNKDVEGLAGWICYDGEPSERQIEMARNAVEYYNQECDLSEYTILDTTEYSTQLDYGDEKHKLFVTGFKYYIRDVNGSVFALTTRIEDGQCFPVMDGSY